MEMTPKARDNAGVKNNSPQTIKQTIKKRSIEQVEGISAVEDSPCPGLNGKEVTIRTNFTMTVKEPVKPYGLKVELVISAFSVVRQIRIHLLSFSVSSSFDFSTSSSSVARSCLLSSLQYLASLS